jgi:hypothetical protein
MSKIPSAVREKIREEVRKGRSRYDVAAQFGVSPRTVYDYTDDLPKKWRRGIAEEKRELIIKRAKEGQSMLKISEELAISYPTVSKIIREGSTPDPRWPDARGKTLKLLSELSEEGYSLRSDMRAFRKVREYLPSARRINFKGRTICFLDENREEAFILFLEERGVRIKSYKELNTLGGMFGVKLDRDEKRYIIEKFSSPL